MPQVSIHAGNHEARGEDHRPIHSTHAEDDAWAMNSAGGDEADRIHRSQGSRKKPIDADVALIAGGIEPKVIRRIPEVPRYRDSVDDGISRRLSGGARPGDAQPYIAILVAAAAAMADLFAPRDV